MRKIRIGEKLPYNNIEQTGSQVSDSYPLLDSKGNVIYFHSFDYEPFNVYNQWGGSDGYDVYKFDNGMIGISNTQDGGGFGSTFFGASCNMGSGWQLFPSNISCTNTTNSSSGSYNTHNCSISGQGQWPISGVYWEQEGEDFPGNCPKSYSKNTLTSWEVQPSFLFGGKNYNPTKVMPTLVSYHGFETDDGINPTASFLAQAHLEVFYYTQFYGLTRWEVWQPLAQNPPNNGNVEKQCSGSAEATYKNVKFIKIDCHDWSAVRSLGDAPVLPPWPLVNGNLLSKFHFGAGSLAADATRSKIPSSLWHRFGTSKLGHVTNWSLKVGKDSTDSKNGNGVNYLAINCGVSGPDDACGPLGSQGVYQDVPISTAMALTASKSKLSSGTKSNISASNTFLFGANVRTQTGTGTFQVALQLLSISGKVLWQEVAVDSVGSDNGAQVPESIYLSCKFISKVVDVPTMQSLTTIHAKVKSDPPQTLRLVLIPGDDKTYFILDAFLNKFPKPQ